LKEFFWRSSRFKNSVCQDLKPYHFSSGHDRDQNSKFYFRESFNLTHHWKNPLRNIPWTSKFRIFCSKALIVFSHYPYGPYYMTRIMWVIICGPNCYTQWPEYIFCLGSKNNPSLILSWNDRLSSLLCPPVQCDRLILRIFRWLVITNDS